jgi:ATP-dependent exoDNAse (exonuclease V) beta subunit
MITFNSENHSYTDKDGNNYFSVSSVINNYKNKFDSDFWAEKKALERGITKEEVLQEWSDKALEATTKGTNIHQLLEDYFLLDKEHQEILKYIPVISKWKATGNSFLPEQLLYSTKYKVAGTADMLVVTKEKTSILDWKTNKEIKLSNKYQKMLGICSHLDDCSFNHYVLQLNLYAFLLKEMYETICYKATIVHLTNKLNLLPVKLDLDFAEQLLIDFNQNLCLKN